MVIGIVVQYVFRYIVCTAEIMVNRILDRALILTTNPILK